MNSIPLNRSFVADLIKERWDSISELEKGWLERVATGLQKTGTARDRATLYRWLANGLPNKASDIFGLAATLDVDPIVLLDIESPRFQKLLKVEWIYYLANLERRGRMSAIWPLVRPSKYWPSHAICHDYYDRNWSTYEFKYPAETIKNVYALIGLSPDRHADVRTSHRVYYCAYRREGARDELWRPYGIVRKRGDSAICVGHNGDMLLDEHEKPRQVRVDESGQVDVETFLGPEPCEFKIACLHPFNIELQVPSQAKLALRFRG